jgi:hypothetical protein
MIRVAIFQKARSETCVSALTVNRGIGLGGGRDRLAGLFPLASPICFSDLQRSKRPLNLASQKRSYLSINSAERVDRSKPRGALIETGS